MSNSFENVKTKCKIVQKHLIKGVVIIYLNNGYEKLDIPKEIILDKNKFEI